MTAAGSDNGSDYQHWSDDDEYLSQTAITTHGYDSHNGLRTHVYKPPSPAAPKVLPTPVAQVIYQYPQYPQMMTYPPSQYTYAQPGGVAYGAPAYYAYPQQAMPQPMMNYQVYQPAVAEPQKPAKSKSNTWKGRTKAEVDEDNQKIAKKEGAYDKRKVVPQVKDDQMMWVVEVDGSHTLRTFVTIKDLKGEWKQDPRYEDSYYFVREEEAEKKD